MLASSETLAQPRSQTARYWWSLESQTQTQSSILWNGNKHKVNLQRTEEGVRKEEGEGGGVRKEEREEGEGGGRRRGRRGEGGGGRRRKKKEGEEEEGEEGRGGELPSIGLPLNWTLCSSLKLASCSREEKLISLDTALHFRIFLGTRAEGERGEKVGEGGERESDRMTRGKEREWEKEEGVGRRRGRSERGEKE